MKYFKDSDGSVYAYPKDGSQDHYISEALVLISEEEALSLANPPPKAEDLQASERKWRDASISSTEWIVARHRDEIDMQRQTTLSASQFSELLEYRQSLRGWPESKEFPASELRPSSPSWMV